MLPQPCCADVGGTLCALASWRILPRIHEAHLCLVSRERRSFASSSLSGTTSAVPALSQATCASRLESFGFMRGRKARRRAGRVPLFYHGGNPRFKNGMPDEPAPSADYYRQVAGQIRAFAHAARVPEVRRDLLDLAERFDRMALYVEQRYPERRGVLPPHGEVK